MGAYFTDNKFKKRVLRRFTEKASLGRRFEWVARGYCHSKKWTVIEQNLLFHHSEIDLLVQKDNTSWVIIEVRGVTQGKRRPRDFLQQKKIKKLVQTQRYLSMRFSKKVALVLIEIKGLPPQSLFGCWIVGRFFRGQLSIVEQSIFSSSQQ